MSKPVYTFLIECKNKKECKIGIRNLQKKRRKNIRIIRETHPFRDPETIKSKLLKPNMVKLGMAETINKLKIIK